MKKEALTALHVKHIKPQSRRQEVPAGPPKGLYLVTHPTGRKTWIFRYRYGGRTRGMTLKGAWPEMTLAKARAEAEAARKKLKRGIDPAGEAQKEKPKPELVQTVFDEWMLRKVSGTRTAHEVERAFNKDVLPAWGRRRIDDIGKADVLRLLDSTGDRAPIMANRLLGMLKRYFGWAQERGVIESSPAEGIAPPSRERTRDRALTPDELAEVWRAAEALGYPNGPFIHLLILTAQRRGEVAAMRWEQVDVEAALWSLPKEAVKAGRAHDVPLSGPALDLLDALPRWEGAFVFSTTSGKKPISGFSKMKTRIDAAILEARRKADPNAEEMPRWTMHDLRRSAATQMAKANVAPHVLASLLNHSPGRTLGISAVYIRHQFLRERREALESWAETVLELGGEKLKAEAV